jgi:hypothetical protein
MRPQEDIDAEIADEQSLVQLATRGEAEADFVTAVRAARRARTEAGLDCYFDEKGVGRFTAEQGLKAACHAREDVAAALMLQVLIMKRLDRNYKLIKWSIGLLAIIVLAHLSK